jgi:hypothetical protein
LTQRRQVLGEFNRAQVFSFVVPNREITNMDELVLKVDPEFGNALAP